MRNCKPLGLYYQLKYLNVREVILKVTVNIQCYSLITNVANNSWPFAAYRLISDGRIKEYCGTNEFW